MIVGGKTSMAAKSTDIGMLGIKRRIGRPKLRPDCEQRDIIVEKAIDLFLKSGFAATKMDDLAAECRISKRTIYRLFPSKLDLFKSMVEMHRQSMLVFPEALAAMPLEEALAAIFRLDIDAQSDYRRTAFVLHAFSEARHTPELGEILHAEGGEKSKRMLADWLAERKRDHALNIADPTSAASILMNMVFGAITLKQVEVSSLPGGTDRRSYLRQCIHYFVNGVR